MFNVLDGGDTPEFSPEPQRDGFFFDGWEPELADKVTKDVTYRAKWSPKYTVKYVDGLNGSVFADETYTDLREGDQTPEFAGSTARSGYTFTGWNPEVSDEVVGNVTYTAKYKKNSTPPSPPSPPDPPEPPQPPQPPVEPDKYTVRYTDGLLGQLFDVVFQDVVEGTDTPEFSGNTSRPGYKFIGWLPEIDEKVTANVTYTAVWEEIVPTYIDEDVTLDEETQKAETEIEIKEPYGGDKWIIEYEFVIGDEGFLELFCDEDSEDIVGKLSEVLDIKIVQEENGEVLYEGKLNDMPEEIKTELSGINGETYHYTVTLSLDPEYGDAYSQYVSKVKLGWRIGEHARCKCCLCRIVRYFGGPSCICPWCWIILIILIMLLLGIICYFVGRRKNKKLVEELEKNNATDEEIKDKSYRRIEYIPLGAVTIALAVVALIKWIGKKFKELFEKLKPHLEVFFGKVKEFFAKSVAWVKALFKKDKGGRE